MDIARNELLKEAVVAMHGVLNKSFQLGLSEGANPSTGALYGFRAGEASAVVSEVQKFVDPQNMIGLDIGSDGNPIFPQTISVDYGSGWLGPLIQIHRDSKDLSMFTDASLDYVFSSHCWEDFTEEEKPKVLVEWIRVLKKGGFLILLLPDEQRYRANCAKEGTGSNPAHKDANFSMDKTRAIIQADDCLRTSLKETYSIPTVGIYSFFIVFTKV